MDSFFQLWDNVVITWFAGLILQLAQWTGSGVLAIVAFTLIVRVVLFPLTWQQLRSQRGMMAIQPRIKEAQKKFGKDREKLTEETMRIYREAGVNPAAGCLPLLVQMPIWIALYSALFRLSQHEPLFQQQFLWLDNLGHPDTLHLLGLTLPGVLPVLAMVTQWITQRMMIMPTNDPQQQQMNQIMQFMPLMVLFFGLTVPAGLVLYWVVSNILTGVQQYLTTGWGSLFPAGKGPPSPQLLGPLPPPAPHVRDEPENGATAVEKTPPAEPVKQPAHGHPRRRAGRGKRSGGKR